jgi:hypothetical protein
MGHPAHFARREDPSVRGYRSGACRSWAEAASGRTFGVGASPRSTANTPRVITSARTRIRECYWARRSSRRRRGSRAWSQPSRRARPFVRVFGDLAASASGKQRSSREGEIGEIGEIGERKQHPLMLPEPTTGNAGASNLGFETPRAPLRARIDSRLLALSIHNCAYGSLRADSWATGHSFCSVRTRAMRARGERFVESGRGSACLAS